MPLFYRLAVVCLIAASPSSAEVRLPSVLADHVVLQRGIPIHLWGWASPSEQVTATFRGETQSASADEAGRWNIWLRPAEAGGPYEVTVRGANTITLRDVLVGDVWVASGQSNMEWPVERADRAEDEISNANHPRMRLFHIRNKSSEFPLDDADAEPWTPCTPETVRRFSAVAYFFGRDLQSRNNIPIGLISSSWGGSPADAWVSLAGLSSDASLMPVFADWARLMDEEGAINTRRRFKPDQGWRQNMNWSWRPAGLFNAMISPVTPFPIRGAIWYQGESNASAERAPIYGHLFQAMIRDWRRAWGIGDFPFLFVQLANWKPGSDEWWPEVREAQRQTLGLANTGMAVTIDIGDPGDIHPTNKQDVGKRLALWARALAGEKVTPSGPLFRQATREGGALRAWFDYGDGLTAKGGAPTGFEIAGSDRKFVAAEARIDGDTVLVSSPAVANPVLVRYGWKGNPECNLFNGAGLPASPFRSWQ